VIGVRKAGKTATEISEYPGLLDRFDQKVTLDKKFIHVARNPFDCITTTFHKTRRRRGEDPGEHLNREIERYFVRCGSVATVAEKFGPKSLKIIHLEQVISDPAHELTDLCAFLGLDSPAEYLASCAGIVNDAPNQTRRTITWDPNSSELVLAHMQRFPWLQRYLA
jgi:hypothetical protein